MIIAQNIHKEFLSKDGQNVRALKNVSLTIGQGEFIAIVGPSGCGKTTLLKLLTGLIHPDSGYISINNVPIDLFRGSIGYMSQADSLLPWRTVSQNIQLGLEIRGISAGQRKKKALELINRMGLYGFEDKYPFELSGGMKKRAAIMRALAYDPEIIFMDEPFGALDVQTRDILEDDILRVWGETGKTIVFVTHDLSEAITLADRVVLMTSRPGMIKNEYKIDLPRPRTTDIRLTPEFQSILRQMWTGLSEEVKIFREESIDKK